MDIIDVFVMWLVRVFVCVCFCAMCVFVCALSVFTWFVCIYVIFCVCVSVMCVCVFPAPAFSWTEDDIFSHLESLEQLYQLTRFLI